MANPQTSDGFTRIANDILEALCHIRINGEARQVLDCIFRQTYGFNKTVEIITLGKISVMTGLRKSTIIKARKKLISMNLITQKGNDKYSFQKDFDVWKPLPKKEKLPKKETIVTQKGNLPLPKKEISTDEPKDMIKDMIKDIGDFSVFKITPEQTNLLNTGFEHYKDMRKKIKKPLTGYACRLAIKKLHRLSNGNVGVAINILNESIMGSWQGLFPLKTEKWTKPQKPEEDLSPEAQQTHMEIERIDKERKQKEQENGTDATIV